MKNLPSALLALALQGTTVSATEQIVTLGDSLTFAYEAEFCFQQTVVGIGTIGDGFDSRVRNWIEVLGNPIYRGEHFELGTRDSVTVTPPFGAPFDLYFRQSQNWAIPGLKIDGLRQFLAGEATFNELLDSATLNLILSYSDFNQTTDFALADMEDQIQNTAERLTVFIGGNDVKQIYGTIYDGFGAGTFVADFMADMTAILDRVQTLNPNLPIVVVNVPHVGITPLVRQSWPYDVVKTERVTAVLRDLNGQLANLAAARGLGYADIFTPLLRQLVPGVGMWLQGAIFSNVGTTTTDMTKLWLNGDSSNNFHPNTNGQVMIANEIIDAFNRRYSTGIKPLSATEMLGGLLEKTAGEMDMSFTNYMNRTSLPDNLPPSDDTDGDGILAGVEYALGLNPARHDSWKVTSRIVGSELELAYPARLPVSARYSFTPESATTLPEPFTPFVTQPAEGTDGLHRARIPLGAGKGFLRLITTIL